MEYGKHLDPDSRRAAHELPEVTFRERKNPQEQRAMAAYEKAGWQIVTRGMPCFIAKKQGEWLRIVWVEPAGGWRTVQKAMQAIFRNLGLNVKIVGYKQEPACEPNEGLPEFCPRCNHLLARK